VPTKKKEDSANTMHFDITWVVGLQCKNKLLGDQVLILAFMTDMDKCSNAIRLSGREPEKAASVEEEKKTEHKTHKGIKRIIAQEDR
jgi:hypothetical protein